VANLLVAAGANRILTMDCTRNKFRAFLIIPVDSLCRPGDVEYLKKKGHDRPRCRQPGRRRIKMAHAYAQFLDAGLAIVAKRRKSATEIEAMTVIGEIRGKNVLMVDDLTETAGTLTAAAKLLKKEGREESHCLRFHAIFKRFGHRKTFEIDY